MRSPRCLVLVAMACLLSARIASSAQPLPRSSPESQGADSRQVLALVDALSRIEHVHSLMLLRHGHVIAEGWWKPYEASGNHELYSLSKSFTSTAVGFAVAEGLLSVDDEVLKFFPEDAPADPSANLKAMRVRDLLTMSAGHQDETSSAPDRISAKAFLNHPVPHKPGTHFKYNTPATFMLSAIVQKQTGQPIADYLRPRLFEPLGIEKPVWSTNFQGISLGGYGLRVRTEDIARFGQFYLQEGRWNRKPLLPAAWIQEATGRQVSNGSNPKSDWDQGYGYQFWRCRQGAYRGDGAFGQYCIVFPEHDVVLAITSGLRDMQGVLDQIWTHLLPGFHPRRLRSNAPAQRELTERLASLVIPVPTGSAQASGLGAAGLGRTYRFPANDMNLESIAIQPDPDGKGWILVQNLAGTETRVPCGHGEWRKSRGRFATYADEPLAASGAWTDEKTFVAQICATETPYMARLSLKFGDSEVTREWSLNVNFGPTTSPILVGRADSQARPSN